MRTAYFFSSLESLDFVRAAAFLWIRWCLTALSSALVAFVIDAAVGDLRAFFTNDLSVALVFAFFLVTARSWRSFFDACFVIGMRVSIPYLTLVGQDDSDL